MNNISNLQTKKCKVCLIEKSISDFDKHRYKCKKCKNIYNNQRNLITGKIKNKDGSKKKHIPVNDLTNKKFGKLIVLEFIGMKDNKNHNGKRLAYFRCRCDCGGEKLVAGAYLKNGNVKSCGCLCHGQMGERSKNWTGYKGLSGTSWCKIERNAFNHVRFKRKNLEFNITKEYVWELYEKQNRKCAISGVDIILDVGCNRERNQTASLDRIDSSKGYTIDNVQWVHKDVNWMKQDFDEPYFIKICNIISNYNKDKIF